MLNINNLLGNNDGGTFQANGRTLRGSSASGITTTDPQGGFWNNLGDMIGWGSASRNREFEANEAALNRAFQQNSANIAMNFEAEEAQKNRDFQERMARNSYQYAVEDLKAAGLNPILAATNGGASTPSGASATGKNASGGTAKGSEAGVGNGIQLITAITGSAKDISGLIKKGFTVGF